MAASSPREEMEAPGRGSDRQALEMTSAGQGQDPAFQALGPAASSAVTNVAERRTFCGRPHLILTAALQGEPS